MKNVTPGSAEPRLMTADEMIAEIADPAKHAEWELRVRLSMAAAEAAERPACKPPAALLDPSGDLARVEYLMGEALSFAEGRVTAKTMREIAGIREELGAADVFRAIADLLDPGTGRGSFPAVTAARWERFRADLAVVRAEALARKEPLMPLTEAAASRLDAEGVTPEQVLSCDPHRDDPDRLDMPVVRLAAVLASRQGGQE